MQKKKIFKIEDSNIEGIGTDADKNCRKTAAATEKQWKKVKKQPGRWAWRIEKFKVKPNEDAKTNGVFYKDDSYIFLHCKTDPDNDSKLLWDVHFWLGETTSQDEAGTAAYKTVELDDFLGGDPIQHREVCGYESDLFLSYFDQGIRLLEGGIESGFNHVKPETFEPRLLWIKGRKHVRVTEVPIEVKSLNSGDVFVLDTGLNLYQFQGKKCGKNEKLQAGKLQRAIDDERKGKPDVFVFSQTDKADDDTMCIFWSYFESDLKDDDVKQGQPVDPEISERLLKEIPEDEGGCDEDWEKKSEKRLMQLSDATGELEFTEVAKGSASKDLLDTNDVFIFDIGNEIYVWIGKGASDDEKNKGMSYATKYLQKFDRPLALPVTQIFEGGENEVFEASFK